MNEDIFNKNNLIDYIKSFEEKDKKFNSLIENKENIKNLFNEYTYFCEFILDTFHYMEVENYALSTLTDNMQFYNHVFYSSKTKDFGDKLIADEDNINSKYSLSVDDNTNYYFKKLFYVILTDEELTNFLIKKYKVYRMKKELGSE